MKDKMAMTITKGYEGGRVRSFLASPPIASWDRARLILCAFDDSHRPALRRDATRLDSTRRQGDSESDSNGRLIVVKEKKPFRSAVMLGSGAF